MDPFKIFKDNPSYTILLIVILAVAIFAYLALAVGFTLTTLSPTNNSQVFNTTGQSNLTITTNSSSSRCRTILGNSTGVTYNMVNESAANTSWRFMVNELANGNVSRSAAFVCDDGLGNNSWSNTSATAGLLIYYMNEIAVSGDTFTDNVNIANLSNTSFVPIFNVSTTKQFTNCNYMVNNNGTMLTMTNNSNRIYWTNSSPTILADSAYNAFANYTYRCQDSFNNFTWLNTSSSAGFKFFHLDTTVPVIVADNVTLVRKNTNLSNTADTTNGLNVTFNVSDISYGGPGSQCWVSYYTGRTWTNTTATHISALGTNTTCNLELNSTQLTSDGDVYITYFANDSAGKVSAVSSNQNYRNFSSITRLTATANVWTQLAAFGNQTLLQLCLDVPNCKYVSFFNSTNTTKAHATFDATTGSSGPNNVTLATDGWGVSIFTSKSTVIFRLNYTSSFFAQNITVTSNTSTTDFPWNLVGVYNNLGRRSSNICAIQSNITHISFFNSSTSTFVPFVCNQVGLASYNVTVNRGFAAWVRVNGTNSINP